MIVVRVTLSKASVCDLSDCSAGNNNAGNCTNIAYGEEKEAGGEGEMGREGDQGKGRGGTHVGVKRGGDS